MRRIRLIAAACCCLLLTGCADMSLSDAELLAPPMAQGAQSELQALIAASAGGDYSLVYPSSGDYQNAVIFRDIDADGEEEAIAMYRGADEGAHVLFARREDSGYAPLGEATVAGSPIEQVDFADLDGDGKEEFYLTYPDKTSPLSSLSVIRVGEEVAQVDMTACCKTAVTGDFDSDGVQDILLLCLSSNAGTAAAKLLAYADGALSVKASCEMDSQISGYAKITCGEIGEAVSGIIVDGHTPSGEYTTQVIYYEPTTRSLLNPLFIYAGYESTRRTVAIFSTDADRDGTVEVPVCTLCDYAEGEDVRTVCRQVTWNSFSPSEMSLVSKKTSVLCENLGFMLHLSDDRVGAVTARCGDGDTVNFYVWEFLNGELSCTDLLLTIRRSEKDGYDSGRVLEPVLAESAGWVYTYVIAPGENPLGYTDEEVTGSFVLTE